MTEDLERLVQDAQKEFQNLVLTVGGRPPGAPQGKGAPGGNAGALYLPTAVRITGFRSEVDAPDHELSKVAVVDPSSFLTGNEPNVHPALSAPCPVVQAPAITGVVGEFGVGKSALLAQLDDWLKDRWRKADPRPHVLPVGLMSLSDELSKFDAGQVPEEGEAYDYVGLLFGRPLADRPHVRDELLREIRSGHILLALDGLDEVFHNKGAIRWFFDRLLLHVLGMGRDRLGTEAARFNVVVTMRIEFLRSFYCVEEQTFQELVRGETERGQRGKFHLFNIFFAEITGFNPSQLKAYLLGSLIEPEIVGKVMSNEKLKSILYRPLYARLLCELLKGKLVADELVSRPLVSVELLEEFVSAAVCKPPDATRELRLSPGKLAETAMGLYKKSGGLIDWMELREVMKCVEPVGAAGPAPAGADDNAQDSGKLRSIKDIIHKSPLLIRRDTFMPQSHVNAQERKQEQAKAARGDRYKIGFAHRAFFEYFTALGVRNETTTADELERGWFRFERFDDLVLNVDMRKFLRELVGPVEWKERTRISYGLSEVFKPEWDQLCEPGYDRWFSKDARAELDDVRYTLLKVMTYPKRQGDQPLDATDRPPEVTAIEDAIRRILDKRRHWNHPLFLVPNFEAIAVYLQHYSVESRDVLKKQFDDILKEQMDRGLAWLADPTNRSKVEWPLREEETTDYLRKSFGLLVERCLHIGYRLGFTWARGVVRRADSEEERKALAEQQIQGRFRAIEDPPTRERITRLLQEIAAQPRNL